MVWRVCQEVIVTDGRVNGSGRWSLRKTGPDLSGSYRLLYLKFHTKKLIFELVSEESLPLQCIQRELQSSYNNRAYQKHFSVVYFRLKGLNHSSIVLVNGNHEPYRGDDCHEVWKSDIEEEQYF